MVDRSKVLAELNGCEFIFEWSAVLRGVIWVVELSGNGVLQAFSGVKWVVELNGWWC